MTGKLVGIYTAPDGGKPMEAHTEVEAVVGAGLAGDRYANKSGEFSDQPGTGREVTLIAREGIADANLDGVAIAEHETRRNLVTEGIDLDELVGKTFTVGGVVLRGVRDCPPCQYLQGITRPGVLLALKGRGGLRADVVSTGVLRVGDEITAV
jgi:MOSC domain-containing protein YiiM